ncbi:hypothetical protein C4N16_01910 [Fusobacterium gonidiaformans ATCC 25563]|uniref:Uncharacterized protein n=2 Tax=Fusobacteriaceae TaxID=203492 RepID=A0AAN3VXQ6_9FUSO|nr:hypothetical protein [Fusobacterium necrophorum]AVQ16359.1 hypothetical protein C4N16_01910 [Fusobacterium gonidiaformans ATCC 25563]EFS28932.1 hypothetical protein FGAG_01253 [Fusobacterium gonidiaformans ATCC 25563]EJU19068.1 hypothetical protein HMPREF1127_1748 [Fusobacterium necrophorum subsp. funduliforme Fnf 1007]KYM51834.1 hypothetical protein A2U04_10920 [Fusobacterium necrophorum subsp. funduliforme]
MEVSKLAKIKKEEIVKEQMSKIYIGPTISKYHLLENSVYLNIYPNNVQEAIQEYPIAAKLFIEIEKIHERNSEQNKIYYDLLKEKLGGK